MIKSERQLVKSLRTLKSDPRFFASAEQEKKTRAELFARIYQEAEVQGEAPTSFYARFRTAGKLFIPVKMWRYALQPALVLTLVLGITSGGWITGVQASSQSLPGDMLYPVKLASEKTQVALASLTHDIRVVTDLRVAFATRRLEEARRVTGQKDAGKDADVERNRRATVAVKGFKEQLSTLHDSLNEVKKNNPEQAAEMAKQVEHKSGAMVDALAQVKEATGEAPDVQNEIREAEAIVRQASDTAVAVIVEKHAAGDPGITEKDIRDTVEDKLSRAEQSTHGVGAVDTKTVAETVKQAEKLIKQKDFEEALTRVRQIQEIAEANSLAVASSTETGVGDKSLVDTIVRVIKNVTSTIIGE